MSSYLYLILFTFRNYRAYVPTTRVQANRLEISRLFQRFNFGPRPGEFSAALKAGLAKSSEKILTPSITDAGLATIPDLDLRDLGQRPKPNSPEVAPFVLEMKQQNINLLIWWMDRMYAADNPLNERVTWFWHGHWATSLDKLNYALPMYRQNQTLRKYALGNFQELSKAMINDGALQFWLDGDGSSVKAPNENLSRELMELFLLGVNRYSEDDVKSVARALTGYLVTRSNGDVTFKEARHDPSPMTVLGTTQNFNGESVTAHLTNQSNCKLFIQERLWYRFISSSRPIPDSELAKNSFDTFDTAALVKSLGTSKEMAKVENSMAKAPVEWFIGICRAFNLQPSKFNPPEKLINLLDKLGQKPFFPPNVGGWPADEAWLTTASAQFRITFVESILKQVDLSTLTSTPESDRVDYLADLLGVYQWSNRTYIALTSVKSDPTRIAQMALCSPEYLVSA